MTTVNNTNNRSSTRPSQRGRPRSHQRLDAIHTPGRRFLTRSQYEPVNRARHQARGSSAAATTVGEMWTYHIARWKPGELKRMRAPARRERWVDQHDLICPGGFRCRGRSCWPGNQSRPSPPTIYADLPPRRAGRRRRATPQPDTGDPKQEVRLRQGSRRPRRATDAVTVSRVVDSSGYVSFAGTNYRVSNGWRGRSAEVCIVAGSVPLSCDGHILRVHPIRHDRAEEHGSGRNHPPAEPPR